MSNSKSHKTLKVLETVFCEYSELKSTVMSRWQAKNYFDKN